MAVFVNRMDYGHFLEQFNMGGMGEVEMVTCIINDGEAGCMDGEGVSGPFEPTAARRL